MAAPVPVEIADRIGDALASLRAEYPTSRWLVPDKLHLTLVFLGTRPSSVVGELVRATADVAARHAPIDAATGEAGGRATDRRGGVAWLRMSRGADELSALALDLDAATGAFTYGERLQPRPHLTVARRVDAATIAALRDWAVHRPPFAWRVDRLTLFRSHLGPKGSRYEELASCPLTARPERA